MFRYIRQVLSVCFVLLGNCIVAQNTTSSLTHTLDDLQRQAAGFPFEKVYLHLDKPYYGAGDTIWFKAYTVIGAWHLLSAKSAVLNVDLIDARNIIKKSIKLPLINGLTYGDFALEDTLQQGSYHIRAYTNWMRNAGSEYFFDKVFTIVNAVGNVFTKATYAYAMVNNKQTTTALINYANLAGLPYAGKEVKYEVAFGNVKIAGGKGITDDRGNLAITFGAPKPGSSATGFITSNMLLENQVIANQVIPVKATNADIDVQFFPESGYLVNGIVSKVAFKAVGADGLGVGIKGNITDEQNNEVTTFSTTHLGMGAFILTPLTGKTYKANITLPGGGQQTVDLPWVIDKGYVMTVDDQSDSLNIKIRIVNNGFNGQNGAVTLVAQSGGEVYLQGEGQRGKQVFTATIPRNKLPSGLIQFTLFSDTGEPLNERLVFVQNRDQLNLSLSADKYNYSIHQEAKIVLQAKNKENQPVQGNFSVSVIDESKVPVDENAENAIVSSLLLTSDIKGYIEQPNYYFANINSKTIADLDVLMLTQGYHRFEWKQVLDNNVPDILYPAERAITISGLLKSQDNKLMANARVTLMNNSGGTLLMDTTTDKAGRFVFNLDFKDSSKFTIRPSAKIPGSPVIELDNFPVPINRKNDADIQINPGSTLGAYLQNNKKRYDEEFKYGIGNHFITLKEVKIKTQRPKTEKELRIAKAVEFSANLNGKGSADQIITSEAFEGMGCPRIADCLAGKLLGVTFSSDGTAYSTRGNNSFRGKSPMMVVIDGIPGAGINDINVDDISSIEVLRTAMYTSIYGVRASGGVLVITSKHDNGYQPDVKNNTGIIQPKGYYKSRQFYSPQYDNPATNTSIADLRTTIFWKPIIQTDKDGNASFKYFNAGKGTYRVVVEGIDYSGNLGRQVYRYKVE